MAYPSLDQYNEALQSPQLVLLDRELQAGSLKTTGLGLPLALCGGFALTYTVNVGSAKRFALRCFHKESAELERRYQAISARLKQLKSPYFLPFEFIPKGIRIQGNIFPIVKMAWASGLTLGEFLEKEHGNSSSLGRLRNALAQLATYLEHEGLAHGDIQPGNVMVSPDGGTIQLIDYDGMFVDSLRGSKATELGQLNFQHPKRAATDFNERLDRFSFLSLDVALQALALDRQLWKSSRCDPDALVFRRNDFLDPGSSTVFNTVMKMPTVGTLAKNLAQIAVASFQQIPSLADFLQQKGIPTNVVVFTPHSKSSVIAYQGPYPVCLATDYGSVEAQVGSRIELVGQIHSFRRAYAKNRQPYVFVNFSDWRGKGVKLTIWSDGLQALGPDAPDESWTKRWISVTGLVENAYSGKSKGVKGVEYTHLSITITQRGQIQTLSESEAKFRLTGVRIGSDSVSSRGNADIVQKMAGKTPTNVVPRPVQTSPPPPPPPPQSTNAQVLQRMQQQAPATPPPVASPSWTTRPTPPSPTPVQKQMPAPKSGGMSLGSKIWIGAAALWLLRFCAG